MLEIDQPTASALKRGGQLVASRPSDSGVRVGANSRDLSQELLNAIMGALDAHSP